jgi:hypothetical protein
VKAVAKAHNVIPNELPLALLLLLDLKADDLPILEHFLILQKALIGLLEVLCCSTIENVVYGNGENDIQYHSNDLALEQCVL